MAILKAGEVELPCPISIMVNDELVWSANTGRTTSGEMVGDVIAEKKNIEIEWGILSEIDVGIIKNNLKSGFFPITFRDDGVEMTISAYRGTLAKEQMGYIGDGVYYYRRVTASIVEK